MINTQELKVALIRNRTTQKEVAEKLGISKTGLYKKIHNITEFKASEIRNIRELLKLNDSDVGKIFFAQ